MAKTQRALFFAAALIFLLTGLVFRATAADQPLPSRPHILVDVQSGKVLSHNKAHVRWAPASITKMMTAYTVFKALELQHLAHNSPVRISESALAQPPSKMGFPIGTILTIDAALKIIMVKSANDVSVALAESVGGSEPGFVELMNAHARRLGMLDSRFENPHGLHSPNQYSTAHDIALLSIAITEEFPQYARYFDIPAVRVGKRRLRNHNALLRLFDGTTGLKTGYVCASGYNIAVRTTRDHRTLIAVVLGGSSGLERNVRAARILTEGFSNSKTANALDISEFGKFRKSIFPVDITREICPRKYAATVTPSGRPQTLPSPQDFDGIDAWVVAGKSLGAKKATGKIPLPEERPKEPQLKPKPALLQASAASSSSGDENAGVVPEDEPPTLKELAAVYLVPRGGLREPELISLGGATGPNPFAIKHTDGGVYKAPLPVPERRPPLDSGQSG